MNVGRCKHGIKGNTCGQDCRDLLIHVFEKEVDNRGAQATDKLVELVHCIAIYCVRDCTQIAKVSVVDGILTQEQDLCAGSP